MEALDTGGVYKFLDFLFDGGLHSHFQPYWLYGMQPSPQGINLGIIHCPSDQAVCIIVSMNLSRSLCVPRKCRCGTQVDAQGRHAMVCKKAPGKIARHQVLNEFRYLAGVWFNRSFGC